YHVSKTGSIKGDGSKFSPFLRINQAAQVATAGDKIIVHEGDYRECVTPKNTGLSNFRRIIYEAGEGENVVIKGSEHIKNWEKVEGTIRSEEHTSELQSRFDLVCRLLLEKKKRSTIRPVTLQKQSKRRSETAT